MPQLPAVDLGAVLPPRARRTVYVVFVLALVVGYALDLALDSNPGWLTAVLRTLDGLTPLVLVLAAVNVPTGPVVAGLPGTILPDNAETVGTVRSVDLTAPDGYVGSLGDDTDQGHAPIVNPDDVDGDGHHDRTGRFI